MGLPNFAGGVASFGIPLIGSGPILGIEAAEHEEFFFVSKSGSDSYNGKKPSRAKLTVQAAADLCTHDYGSYVIIGEGQWQEQVGFLKRGVHVIGMGAFRSQIIPESSMTAGDRCTPTVTIAPPHLANKTVGVEIAGLRIGGNGGYSGLYIGDSTTTANASASIVHDCIIDGANREGYIGIFIAGGSWIHIVNNVIGSWQGAGVIIADGAVRTAFGNVVRNNSIIYNSGSGVQLSGICNGNEISGNRIGDHGTALTYGVGGATVISINGVGIPVSSGADNYVCGNWFLSTGTLIDLNAGDHVSGNYDRTAGNGAQFVDEP